MARVSVHPITLAMTTLLTLPPGSGPGDTLSVENVIDSAKVWPFNGFLGRVSG